jgi:hypothetical protein
MNDARRSISKRTLRSSAAVSLIAPIFFAWAAGADLHPARGALAAWRPIATWILLPVAVYLLGGPFVYEFAWRLGERSNTKGRGLENIVLLMGTAGATAVVALAFILVVFGGGSLRQMYGWSILSLAIAFFWCWRYRGTVA